MERLINEMSWKEELKGWIITGCAIRSKNILALCAREDISIEDSSLMYDSEILSRLHIVFLDDKDKPIGSVEFSNVDNPSVGVSRKPVSQSLFASGNINGYVSAIGSGREDEEYIDKGRYPGYKLKCVLDYCYSVGVCRQVYKRTEIGKWVELDKGIDGSRSLAFKDIDAFTEQDIYAVGGDGEVWRYDGDSWSQCGFPSNERLSTVVCAPDGHVYIGGEGGSIWKGRLHTWKKVYSGSFTILWNEMRWFQDKLWVISDYMLRILGDGELIVPQDKQGNDIVLEGHMDVYDGIMAIAGLDRVHTFDGKKLYTIVAPYGTVKLTSSDEF